ncbi:MAG: hypothetical protein WDM80_02345 [Limisphaerales bacterium]
MGKSIKNFLILLNFAPWLAMAQTNEIKVTNRPDDQPLTKIAQAQTNQSPSLAEHVEHVRAACIQGRRLICGKILKVLPDGLIIESGYTNLMRYPLDRSWLVPATAIASRPPDLIEGRETDSVCVGLVFLTDIPKSRSLKPKQYDYVIIQAYPAGNYTYTSLGTIQRTVRRFSAGLPTAVALCLQAEEKSPIHVPEVK